MTINTKSLENLKKGRWKRGESGNPSGRAIAERLWRESLLEKDAEKLNQLFANLFEIATSKDSMAPTCAKILLDRAFAQAGSQSDIKINAVPDFVETLEALIAKEKEEQNNHS